MSSIRCATVLIVFGVCQAGVLAQEQTNVRENLAFLEEAYAGRTKPEAQEWKPRVQAKQADLARDLEWLIANDRGEEALRFVIPYAYFRRSANQPDQAFDALTRVLQLASAQADRSTRARALYDAGVLAFRRNDQARSRTLNDESLAIARRLGDDAAAANALIGLSRIALRDHDYKIVKARAQEAADLRQKLGDGSGRISAMHMVAAAWRMEGSDAKAQELYESTLANYSAHGDKSAVAGEMFNLGYVHLHQNHVARATKLFRDALTEYRAEKDDGGIAYCLTGFAAVAATRRDANRSAELYGAAGAMLERLGIKLDPDDQLDWDRYTELARRRLTAGAYAADYQRGHAMNAEQAIALALGEP